MMKNIKSLICLGVAGLALVLTASSQGQTPGTPKWTYTAQNEISYSAAAIDVNGAIYFADWQTTMYALHSDGSPKWTVSTPNGNLLGESSPVLSANGTTVYYSLIGYEPSGTTYLVGGGITARSTYDGRELWHYSIPTNTVYYNPPISRIAVGSDGTIYFAGPDYKFYALTSSGAFKWAVTPPGGVGITTSPAIGSDGTIYVGSGSGSLIGYYPDGSQKLVCYTDGGAVCSPAIGSDGTIYVGGYGGLYAFNTDGSRKWKYSNSLIIQQFPDSGPTIDENGVIYFDCVGNGTSYNSYLYAINSDGTLKWQFPTGEIQSDGSYSSPAVVADGTIYVGSSTGHKVYAVNSDGSERWEFPTGNKIYSPVAVGSDGTVYVGSLDNKFYAINGSAPLASSAVWPKFQKNAYNLASFATVVPGPLPAPLPPTGLTATAGDSQVALNWNASDNTTCYNIYLAVAVGGPYYNWGSSTLTHYTITGLPNGGTFYFVVTAVGAAESTYSSQVSATPNVPVPTSLAATPGNRQVTLNWNITTGATSYNVKRSTTSGGSYTTIASPASTNYVNTGLANGTTYYYVVSAVTSGGESANSSQVSATPQQPPPVPTNLTATPGNAQVALSWHTSTGATSYNVKRSTTSGGTYTIIASPTATTYTDTTAVNGMTYYYVVSAVKTGVESANSSQVSATLKPSPPTGLTVTPGNARVVLSWNSSTGATSYHVKRSTTSGGTYTTIASPTATTYTNTGLANGTTYYYVVSAINSTGESANSSQVSATPQLPPPVPTGLTATPGNAQVVLGWGSSTGATSYNVKRSTTSGGSYTTIASPTATTYTDTGLVNGIMFYYVVSAVKSGVESANSSQVSATPQPPSCTPAPTNLVSWWPAEGNANDMAGNNNGIPQNINYTDGEVGLAFVFNGSDSLVRVPASSSLDVGLGNGFTIETWVNPASATLNNLQSLLEWNVGSDSVEEPIGAQLGISANFDGDLYANIMDTSLTAHFVATAGGVMTGDGFQHVALTFNKTTGLAVLYRNGVAVQSANLGTGFTPWTSTDFYLGCRPAGPFANHFNGMIDEPSLYNRALSASEIQAIYNAGIAGKCPVNSLATISIAAGRKHALVLKTDGTMLAGGAGGNGQIGDGTTHHRPSLVSVSGLSDVVGVAAGELFSYAWKADGTAWGWGSNAGGQLDPAASNNQTTPIQISGLASVVAMSGGNQHGLAVKANGTVWTWGSNDNGLLGDGTYASHFSTPVQVTGLNSVVAVAGGHCFSLALESDGTVWAWGRNSSGQLGRGTSGGENIVAQVPGLNNVTAIAAGNYHSLALSNGVVWYWGGVYYGGYRIGSTLKYRSPVPINVPGPSPVVAIAAGYYHSLALRADGTVWAWGYNNVGQLGDGTTVNQATPVQVQCLSGINVVAIAAGEEYSMAMASNGNIYTWGYIHYGYADDYNACATDAWWP